MRDTPQTLDKGQVTKILGISMSSLDRAMKKGEIPYFKLGKKVLFLTKDIKNFVKIKSFTPGGERFLSLSDKLEGIVIALEVIKEFKENSALLNKAFKILDDEKQFNSFSKEKKTKFHEILGTLFEKSETLSKEVEELEERSLIKRRFKDSGRIQKEQETI